MNKKKEFEAILSIKEKGNLSEFHSYLEGFLGKFVKQNHYIDNYIGDYPSFIEPVFLGNNVEIGDDVLLGPNVFIGDNCKIGDFNELSNSIILDNVVLGSLFKLKNCIVVSNTLLNIENLSIENCILSGVANSKEELDIKYY
ncbi:MAG: hypothetical protein KGD63_15810 [Candidatus Lokiarchaeota archaeon]|nr:hypothetical protein [Candidatus Lokiarchaeota archaeon]